MRRCILFPDSPLSACSNRPVRRLVLFTALFILAIDAAAGFGQQNLPPPPPPDSAAPASVANSAPEQSDIRAVRVSDVAGQVQVWQDGRLVFPQAEPNMPAVQGMRFVTRENGRLEIEFEDGSVARLAPNSSFRLTRLGRLTDGSTVTRIHALTGLSYYEMNNRDGRVSVVLDHNVAKPEGDVVFRIDLDSNPNTLAVMQGDVHVEADQAVSVNVHPNQTYQTDPQQPGEFTVANSITANSWDQWNSDRDQTLADLESSESSARAAVGNPPDASWNDLDYYGSWYDVPGYGDVWSPNGVGSNWDPYGDGYWGYYSSFGYTWISAYPWGWWPYHCGNWNYLGTWGWAWAPGGGCGWGYYGAGDGGGYGTGWYPYAPLRHCPPGYIPPTRPRQPPANVPRHKLIAVDRGPQDKNPFHFRGGLQAHPRQLDFQGQSIAPIPPVMHPRERGPLGETFTSTLYGQQPGLAPSGIHPWGTPIVRVPPVRMPVESRPIIRRAPPVFRPIRPIEAPRPIAPIESRPFRGAPMPRGGGAPHGAPMGGSHSHR